MQWSSAVIVYKDPGGGSLLVGTWEAALDEASLAKQNVGLIVNCSNREMDKKPPCDYY